MQGLLWRPKIQSIRYKTNPITWNAKAWEKNSLRILLRRLHQPSNFFLVGPYPQSLLKNLWHAGLVPQALIEITAHILWWLYRDINLTVFLNCPSIRVKIRFRYAVRTNVCSWTCVTDHAWEVERVTDVTLITSYKSPEVPLNVLQWKYETSLLH